MRPMPLIQAGKWRAWEDGWPAPVLRVDTATPTASSLREHETAVATACEINDGIVVVAAMPARAGADAGDASAFGLAKDFAVFGAAGGMS